MTTPKTAAPASSMRHALAAAFLALSEEDATRVWGVLSGAFEDQQECEDDAESAALLAALDAVQAAGSEAMAALAEEV